MELNSKLDNLHGNINYGLKAPAGQNSSRRTVLFGTSTFLFTSRKEWTRQPHGSSPRDPPRVASPYQGRMGTNGLGHCRFLGGMQRRSSRRQLCGPCARRHALQTKNHTGAEFARSRCWIGRHTPENYDESKRTHITCHQQQGHTHSALLSGEAAPGATFGQ